MNSFKSQIPFVISDIRKAKTKIRISINDYIHTDI